MKRCEWCGEEFQPRERLRRFCSGSCKGKHIATFRDYTGENNPRFNGGTCVYNGRKLKILPDGSHQLYSRWLMEQHLGYKLDPKQEIVHHINGDPTDDRLENLEVLTRAEHMNLHRDDLLAGKRRKSGIEEETAA